MSNTVEVVVKVKDDIDSDLDSARRHAERAGEIIGDGISKGSDRKSRGLVGRLLGKLDDVGEAILEKTGALGVKIGGMLGDGIGNTLGSMPPQVQAGVAALGVAVVATLGPLIAAGISAGILLGLGGGVLAIGIANALKDPKVEAAWGGFGDRAKKAFEGFGEPFKGPLIRAADTFADALERMAPSLNELGEKMAPLIDKIAPKLAEMAEKAMPGIIDAVEASIPLFETLADKLPEIGEWIGKLFSLIASGGPEANKAFGDIITLLMGMVTQVVVVVVAFTKFYGMLREQTINAARNVRSAWNLMIDIINSWRTRAGNAISAVRGWIEGLVSSVRSARSRIGSAFSGMFDGIKHAFKSAVNWVIERWNNFSIPGVSTPFGTLGGFNTPNIGYFAHGGVSGGGLAMVGERGRELLRLPSGTQVMSNPDTERLMASQGVSKFLVEIGVKPGLSDKLADLLLELLSFKIRTEFGGSVEEALGSGS